MNKIAEGSWEFYAHGSLA